MNNYLTPSILLPPLMSWFLILTLHCPRPVNCFFVSNPFPDSNLPSCLDEMFVEVFIRGRSSCADLKSGQGDPPPFARSISSLMNAWASLLCA